MKTNGNRKQPAARNQECESPEGVLDRLFVWLDNSLVWQTAGELARECHTALWETTCERAREMSRAEARGYIRAYAPEFLLREVAPILQRRRVRESLRQRILDEATDQVVDLVLKDVYRVKSRRVARAA